MNIFPKQTIFLERMCLVRIGPASRLFLNRVFFTVIPPIILPPRMVWTASNSNICRRIWNYLCCSCIVVSRSSIPKLYEPCIFSLSISILSVKVEKAPVDSTSVWVHCFFTALKYLLLSGKYLCWTPCLISILIHSIDRGVVSVWVRFCVHLLSFLGTFCAWLHFTTWIWSLGLSWVESTKLMINLNPPLHKCLLESQREFSYFKIFFQNSKFDSDVLKTWGLLRDQNYNMFGQIWDFILFVAWASSLGAPIFSKGCSK